MSALEIVALGFDRCICKSVAIEKYVPCLATREMILHFQYTNIYSVISVCCFDSWVMLGTCDGMIP